MFLDSQYPGARGAIHVVFLNEKVRPRYVESVPASEPARTKEGILIAPVVDLVHMKLTSFRLKDKVHIQDMDGVGLITPEIEATLSRSLPNASRKFAPPNNHAARYSREILSEVMPFSALRVSTISLAFSTSFE